MTNAVEEDWRVLASLIPQGWQQQATQTGAMSRRRGITDPEVLLRLFLLHVAKGYSLRETSVRAKEGGLAKISDVGLMKRLSRSEDWLHWLCTRLVAENGLQVPADGQRVVRIVDGTVIKETGKTGSEWRIVYSIRLPDLRCDHFALTLTTGEGNGESLARVPVTQGDLILADAGYYSPSGIRTVVSAGGDVLVRVNPNNLRAQDPQGQRFDLLKHLQSLVVAGAVGEWRVTLPGGVSGRICAARKSDQAIRQAHRRIERRASKKQTQTKPETWEYAKYVAVFATDLSSPATTLLEWYRVAGKSS